MRIWFPFFWLVFVGLSVAQPIPIGAWRTHASYQSVQTVALAQQIVYAGALGSFFSYDTEYEQAIPLSRLDGFSGTDISRLAYDAQTQTLVVAYDNGTIDLLQGTNLFTIRAIASSSTISTSKKPFHILIASKLAYLSYSFGVVVIDLEKRQIRETYQNLGSNGTLLAVSGAAILNDQIYLATEAGLLTAPLAGVNLQDYASWQRIATNVPNGAATYLATHTGSLYVAFATNELYQLTNGQWSKATDFPAAEVLFLKESRGKLLIGYAGKIVSLENQKPFLTITHPLIQQPQEAEYDASGKLWIADASSGLLSNSSGDFRLYAPNGTVSNQFQRLARWESEIVALPGGYTQTFAPKSNASGFSVFTDSGWQNSTSQTTETSLRIPTITDVLATTYNPITQETYVASFGNGLLIKRSEGNWQRLTEANAPPQTAKITGLVVDEEGTLWASVYTTDAGENSLFARSTEGQWQSFAFNLFTAKQPTSLLRDDYGYFWMPLASGGLWVFDPANNRGRLLTTVTGQGGLPNNTVYTLAKDALGQIWVGTGRGAAYFFNPYAVFDNQPFDAIAPIFDGRPVLRDEVVTTLHIDGGNRKWFGTRNGAWLFDADITRQLEHFTTQNTPLLSDVIQDLEIQPQTGEVFFATDAGLISYRGTATEATTQHSQVKVFPNPVRPEFDGTVGISGLANNCVVKVTDASGRLVYQTRANGGTATWQVQDYQGRRVGSGVYLIFASSDDGSEKYVAKIAVIE
jgi:ligand-binding sensor domain-containing protein